MLHKREAGEQASIQARASGLGVVFVLSRIFFYPAQIMMTEDSIASKPSSQY
jgi:hypothetical protein